MPMNKLLQEEQLAMIEYLGSKTPEDAARLLQQLDAVASQMVLHPYPHRPFIGPSPQMRAVLEAWENEGGHLHAPAARPARSSSIPPAVNMPVERS
ncbi:MAG: hypothetical protein EOP20_09260 [Hyphomicrobiales bacterium]|nr:MAG: hypothetical protein EOP20_09260 [Hyphomicrobiales bacterium]